MKLPADLAGALDVAGLLEALQRPLSEPASRRDPEVAVEAARRLLARVEAGYRPTSPSGLFVTLREEVTVALGERREVRRGLMPHPLEAYTSDGLLEQRDEIRAYAKHAGIKGDIARELLREVDARLGIAPPAPRVALPVPSAREVQRRALIARLEDNPHHPRADQLRAQIAALS